MSVTIHWRPTETNSRFFASGTSTSFERLVTVFPDKIMDKSAISKLRAMAVASTDNFYREVADVIEQFGPIEFWGEW